MATQATKFKVGIFVTLGVIIGAMGLVWLSASKYFQKTATYVTYFDESVQGLTRDSDVKYRGVDIGRVDKIRVAPDYNLIEVVMKIDFKEDLVQDAVAELKTVGITGIVFVEMDRRAPGEPDLSPKLTFTPDYPVIPSRPSNISQLLTGIQDVYKSIKQVDFKGISDQIKSLTMAMETFVAGPRMDRIVVKLESAVVNLDRAAGKVDKMLGQGKIEDVLVKARDLLTETRTLVAEVRGEVRSFQLAETAGKANRLVNGLEKRTQAAASEIKITSENLRRASETLEMLLERLNANPSDLIFSQPAPPGRKK